MWIINVQYHRFLIRRVDVVYSTDDAMTSTDDTTDVTSSAATSVAYLELKSERSLGPDETTAPLDGTTTSISPPDALTHSSLASSAYSTGTLATSNGPVSNTHRLDIPESGYWQLGVVAYPTGAEASKYAQGHLQQFD